MTYAFSIRGKDLKGNSRWFFVETDLDARSVSTIRWMLRHGASIELEKVVHEELVEIDGLIKTFEEIQQMLRGKE